MVVQVEHKFWNDKVAVGVHGVVEFSGGCGEYCADPKDALCLARESIVRLKIYRVNFFLNCCPSSQLRTEVGRLWSSLPLPVSALELSIIVI